MRETKQTKDLKMVAEISNRNSSSVIIQLTINNDEPIYVQETKNNFTTLKNWLDDYFTTHLDLINKIKKSKTFDLGFGRLGNGITVYNRMVKQRGDYQIVAHIDDNNPLEPTIKYYKTIIKEMKKEIEDFANKIAQEKMAIAVIDLAISKLFIYDVPKHFDSEQIENFLLEQNIHHLSNCSWGVFDGDIEDLREI